MTLTLLIFGPLVLLACVCVFGALVIGRARWHRCPCCGWFHDGDRIMDRLPSVADGVIGTSHCPDCAEKWARK